MQKLITRSLALLLALCATNARAQDVDTFSLSGGNLDRQGTLQVAAPRIGASGAFYAGLGLVYADDPLVAQYEDGTEEVVVASQLSTRLLGGYSFGFARVDLEVPIYPSVRLAEPTAGLSEPEDPASQLAFGNVRLGATVPLLGADGEGLGLAVVPSLDLPTGSQDAYVSNGGVGGAVKAAVGSKVGDFGWGADLGVGLSRTAALDDTLSLGNNVHGGVNARYHVSEAVVAGAEASVLLPFVDGFDPWNKRDAEAHLYGTWLGERGLVATLGGGTGLLAGVGAPDWRVALALGYSTPPGPRDRDGDGIVDDLDRCPLVPEDKDQFEDEDGCPDPDNDQDGLLDVADSCPNDPEDKDQFEDMDGCPDPDNDKDLTLDVDDKCPLEPGPQITRGCPDRDGDRVPDYRDKCPDEPVDQRADPELSDGCPTRAVLTREKIEILDKVFFDFDKATIKPESYPLLDDVAKVLRNNPHVKRVEVAGHTDDKGDDKYNVKLSQARVESVVKYLVVTGGIDAARLSAKGYGESQPVVPNDTEEGRANNRRVEFVILEQE